MHSNEWIFRQLNKWGKYDYVVNEKYILNTVSHPFIISLICNIETEKHLYFLLDFCPGGDLFYLISKQTKLSEKLAKFYIIEIILAIEYLHSMNILYRDLKPTNVLIDAEGHIKLTDFGLSSPFFLENSTSTEFCGTPEYMSPEMLMKTGHDRTLDYYSIGIILYEMLVGIPPFYNEDRKKMYSSILNDKIKFYSHISQQARDLIRSKFGFLEIKQHQFFKGVNWKKHLLKEVTPPYVPSMRVSNFSEEFTKIPIENIKSISESEEDKRTSMTADKKYKSEYSSNEAQLCFSDQHNQVIQDNRIQILSEFESWYAEKNNENETNIDQMNINPPENTQGVLSENLESFASEIELDGNIKERPVLRINLQSATNKLRQLSPCSSVDLMSIDSPMNCELINESESRRALFHRGKTESIKYNVESLDLNVFSDISEYKKHGTFKEIANVDLDYLADIQNISIRSDRKRVIPDYTYDSDVEVIECEVDSSEQDRSVIASEAHIPRQNSSPKLRSNKSINVSQNVMK